MSAVDVRLGPFTLERPIGSGGMGQVWRARHEATDTFVAVKVVRRPGSGDAERAWEAFRSEVRAVARLSHPRIITVLDQGEVEPAAAKASGDALVAGSPYLAMELVEGGPLAKQLRPFPWPALRALLRAILDALAHAHAHGVVHRDLKPANVLLEAGGDPSRIKLTDFGIAHAFDAGGSDINRTIAGTLHYMAPEQIRGRVRDQGPATDLYGFGAMAWELATGLPPFASFADHQLAQCQLHIPPPPLCGLLPLPAGFAAWLRTLLEKAPEDRFQLAADARAALDALPEPSGDAWGEVAEAQVLPVPAADAATATVVDLALQGVDEVEPGAGAAASSPREGARPRPRPDFPEWREGLPEPPSTQLLGAGLGLYGLRPIPLVGRQAERDRLWGALREVRETREPRVLVLGGPAGTGKSRLAEWCGRRALELGVGWFEAASLGPRQEGLATLVAQCLRCAGLDAGAAAARVARVFDEEEALAIAALIAPIVGEEAGAARRVRLDSEAERHEVVASVLRWVVRDGRPLVLWLDDVHWDVGALGFVEWLLERAGLPVLALLTARDEALAERPEAKRALRELARHAAASRLRIGPLTARETEILVGRLLHLEGEPARRLQARCAGNPLFAVQLVGDWVSRGVLEVGQRGFRVRAGASLALPDDIFEVWAARVERVTEGLGAGAQEALELASVLGVNVVRKEWEAVCEDARVAPPAALLEQLLSQRLARPTQRGWAFGHGMLVEALERMAAEAGRLEGHHRRVAAVLEARGAAPGRIGQHLVLAGAHAEALSWLAKGARARYEAGDFVVAQRLFDQLEAALDAAGAPAEDVRRGQAWVLRARASVDRGRLDEAERYAARVEEGARAHGWGPLLVARAAVVRGWVALQRGATAVSHRWFTDALRSLSVLDHGVRLEAGLADCLTGLGAACVWRGELDAARTHYERAMELQVQMRDRFALGQSLCGLAQVQLALGELDQADAFLARARRTFERGGHRAFIANVDNDLGEVARARGDFEAAAAHYERSAALYERLGSDKVSTPRLNLALLLVLEQGRWAEGRAILEADRAKVVASQRPMDLLWLDAALLVCAAGEHDDEAFDRLLGGLEEGLAESGFVGEDLARCASQAAALALEAGHPERAQRAARLAEEQLSRLGRGDPG